MRAAIVVAVACLSAAGLCAGQDVRASIKKSTNIPAQQLAAALKALAYERGIQVVFLSEVVRAKQTQGAVGELTTTEALTRLLKGTNLKYSYLDDKTVTIFPVNSNDKLDQQGASAGNLHRCSGLSSNKLDYATSLNWTGSEGAPDCTESDSIENQVLATRIASAEDEPVQNSDGESSLNKDSTDDNRLEEVVVTAQKRKERQKDVPASITALRGEQLEKTEPQSLVDIAGYVPGLMVASADTRGGTPGQTQITLRGIATQASLGSLVGTYIDEVPVGSSTAYINGSFFSPDLMPYDLDRLEVLRGPQGTLYGSSAMGGLLKYVFKTPDLTQFSARAGLTGNSINYSGSLGGGARASINIPLMDDQLGIRVSGFHQKTLGYVNDVGLNEEHSNPYTQEGGRVAALWKLSDKFSIKVSALLQNTDATGAANETIDPLTLKPVAGGYKMISYVQRSFDQKTRVYSIAADWDAGFATLTSVSSWEQSDITWVQDQTPGWRSFISGITKIPADNVFVPYPNINNLEKFTQEVRLASSTAQRFSWLLGAFYAHEDTEGIYNLLAQDASGAPLPGVNPTFANETVASYQEIAPFADGTVNFGDQFALTMGVRYAKNEQIVRSTSSSAIFALGPPFRLTTDEGVTTWMVSSQWHPNKDNMIYARVATGYRPGGLNVAVGPPAYLADTLTNYEVGYKSTMPNIGLSMDVSLYDIEWDKMQGNVCIPGGFCYIGNATTARSQGGEIATQYAMDNGLRLGASLGYVDARLTGDAPALGGKSGDYLGQAPKWNGALTVDYARAISDRVRLEAGAGYRLSSELWSGPSSSPRATRTKQACPVDLYVGTQAKQINARLFVRNVFNSNSKFTLLRNPETIPENSLVLVPYQPRTIGLSVDWQF